MVQRPDQPGDEQRGLAEVIVVGSAAIVGAKNGVELVKSLKKPAKK